MKKPGGEGIWFYWVGELMEGRNVGPVNVEHPFKVLTLEGPRKMR